MLSLNTTIAGAYLILVITPLRGGNEIERLLNLPRDTQHVSEDPSLNDLFLELDFFFLRIYILTHFKGSVTGLGGGCGKLFHLLVHSPNGHVSQLWRRQKPGDWNSFQVSLMDGHLVLPVQEHPNTACWSQESQLRLLCPGPGQLQLGSWHPHCAAS